jgi:hypothetical protein
MKTRSIYLILLTILSSITTQAQVEQTDLCKAFLKLSEKAENSFDGLIGNSIENKNGYKTFDSKVIINEAKSSVFNFGLFEDITFVANFGEFDTEIDAQKKVESLSAFTKSCFSTVDFSIGNEGLFKYKTYFFIHKAEKGMRFYKAKFEIQNFGQKFKVLFKYPASQKASSINLEESPSFIDYTYVENVADNQPFSIDLKKILYEASTGFVNLQGPKIKSEFYLFTRYDAKIDVTGFPNCYIEDKTNNLIFYKIPCYKGLKVDAIQPKVLEVVQKIKNALGKDYAYCGSKDGMKMTFVNKKKPQTNLLNVLLEYQNDAFDILISVISTKPI